MPFCNKKKLADKKGARLWTEQLLKENIPETISWVCQPPGGTQSSLGITTDLQIWPEGNGSFGGRAV